MTINKAARWRSVLRRGEITPDRTRLSSNAWSAVYRQSFSGSATKDARNEFLVRVFIEIVNRNFALSRLALSRSALSVARAAALRAGGLLMSMKTAATHVATISAPT